MKLNIDILWKYFTFLAYQRSVQLLYELLDTFIEALTAFTIRQSWFSRKQTDKSKDQALKQHYFSRIGPLFLLYSETRVGNAALISLKLSLLP